jgi:hypothetical protein
MADERDRVFFRVGDRFIHRDAIAQVVLGASESAKVYFRDSGHTPIELTGRDAATLVWRLSSMTYHVKPREGDGGKSPAQKI